MKTKTITLKAKINGKKREWLLDSATFERFESMFDEYELIDVDVLPKDFKITLVQVDPKTHEIIM